MKIYIMGICGTAMAHVALLLKQLGHQVCGADQNFFDPIASLLKENKITTKQGYAVEELKAISPDIVIVGNVISRGNPEVEFLLNTHAFPFYSFPHFLETELFRKRDMWVVTGTHGKTTTTSLVAYLLQSCCHPGYLIGGLPKDFPCGSDLGEATSPFVIEGDEYDTAFFDKRSKFFRYWPRTLIINNIEFDHADIFRDLTSIQRSFYQLTRMLPSQGHLILNGDDPCTMELLPCDWTQIHTVGFSSHNHWQIRNFKETSLGIKFDLYRNNECIYKSIFTPLWGDFNARNVAMACVACFENHYPIHVERLKYFHGVARRQTKLKETENFVFVEDFGHHPTAISATLKSLKGIYPHHHIIACFEPACNTSASVYFQAHAEQAFTYADDIWLLPAKAQIYSDKFVQDISPIDLKCIQQKLSLTHPEVLQLESYQDLIPLLKRDVSVPTVICAFSNGKLSAFLHKFFK